MLRFVAAARGFVVLLEWMLAPDSLLLADTSWDNSVVDSFEVEASGLDKQASFASLAAWMDFELPSVDASATLGFAMELVVGIAASLAVFAHIAVDYTLGLGKFVLDKLVLQVQHKSVALEFGGCSYSLAR